MLYEIITEKAFSNTCTRRWFESENLELVVWLDNSEEIASFQLCYQQGAMEHALTWQASSGFSQALIDDGESRTMHHKGSPILRPNGMCDVAAIASDFARLSTNIDRKIAVFVLDKLALQNGQ